MVYLFKPVLTNDPYDIHGFWQDDTAYKQNYSNNNEKKKPISRAIFHQAHVI